LNKSNLISWLIVFLLLSAPALEAASQTVENLLKASEFVKRGDLLMNMNLWDDAEQEYWKAVELDYYNVRARKGLGDVYRKKKMFEKAIENYQIVINQQPDNEDVQYLISLSYYDNNQYEMAKIAAEKALQMNPDLAKAENLVRLSKAKQLEQKNELAILRQKELEALQRFSQIQKAKENALIGRFVPGWRLIQTAEPKPMWTGYAILGTTVGLFLGGYFLRSAGAKAYNEAAEALSLEIYQNRVDLGQSRYKVGGYLIDTGLGIFFLNMVDSFLLHGKIFGGGAQVKPSLPERERHKKY